MKLANWVRDSLFVDSVVFVMPRYDDSLRQLIGTNIEAGADRLDIAERLGVSPQLVSYYRRKLATWGSVVTPPLVPLGGKRKIHLAAIKGIRELLADNPTIYLNEL